MSHRSTSGGFLGLFSSEMNGHQRLGGVRAKNKIGSERFHNADIGENPTTQIDRATAREGREGGGRPSWASHPLSFLNPNPINR